MDPGKRKERVSRGRNHCAHTAVLDREAGEQARTLPARLRQGCEESASRRKTEEGSTRGGRPPTCREVPPIQGRASCLAPRGSTDVFEQGTDVAREAFLEGYSGIGVHRAPGRRARWMEGISKTTGQEQRFVTMRRC